MSKDGVTIEKMMEEHKCSGKRVTLALIESHIQSVDYQTVEINGQRMMFCGIRMDNGFVAVGKPATCIDPANWREEIGRKICYDNSFEELWKLEAYRLMSDTSPAAIAKIAHEVNRAYCHATGDDSQVAWEDAPEWQRDSAVNGVKFHLTGDHEPQASHESWLAQKQTEGWTYGPVKDVERKEHPCFLPYEQLPTEQRVKDYLFRAVVHSFK